MYPDQFKVNEAWIAAKLFNSSFIVMEGLYDIYVLLDAGSAYLFGYILAKAIDNAPNNKDVAELFQKAYLTKNQWPEKLIVPENFTAAAVFKEHAEKNNLIYTEVPLSDLSPIIGPMEEYLHEKFSQPD
jgi:hypothetical protein